jgi:hypothetical protein
MDIAVFNAKVSLGAGRRGGGALYCLWGQVYCLDTRTALIGLDMHAFVLG